MYLKSFLIEDILKAVMLNVVVSIVPADGLAPLGARPSAGTVMTSFMSHIYVGPALGGLTP